MKEIYRCDLLEKLPRSRLVLCPKIYVPLNILIRIFNSFRFSHLIHLKTHFYIKIATNLAQKVMPNFSYKWMNFYVYWRFLSSRSTEIKITPNLILLGTKNLSISTLKCTNYYQIKNGMSPYQSKCSYSIHSGANWDRRKTAGFRECSLIRQKLKMQWISSTSDQHLISLLQSYVSLIE